MALTQNERISLSKRFVSIPDENAAFASNAATLQELVDAEADKDEGFKGLFAADNQLIDLYHDEVTEVFGQNRTSVTEQNLQDSADKIDGNFFFPQLPDVPTASLPNGVWTQFKAFARNIAVGRLYDESFDTVDSESDKISDVTTLTAKIAADYTQTERQTGTTFPPPTPPATFDLPADLASLKTAVNTWEASLNTQRTALLANTDPERTSEIAAAIADIDDALVEISDWNALPDYAVGGKVDDPGLLILNDEAAARNSFIPTRQSQINSRLGSVNQDISDGTITSLSGLYGNRYINIDARVNLVQGSLSQSSRLELGKKAQDQGADNNTQYLNYLTNIIVATKLAADGTGANTIEVEDVSNFSISDTVFVVSDTQSELTGTITNISGTTVTLSFNVPSSYIVVELARMYKEV